MKHNQNNRRQRSRGNGRRYPNQRGGSFESSGPEVKVRGTAQQVLEKYQSLARDAFSSGDRILAEGYLQHAEHYYRILNADNEGQGRDQNRNRNARGNRDEDMHDDGDDSGVDETEASKEDAGEEAASASVEAKQADAGESDGAAEGDAVVAEENTEEKSEEEPRPRRPRGRRPRKTEQPELAVEPAVGD